MKTARYSIMLFLFIFMANLPFTETAKAEKTYNVSSKHYRVDIGSFGSMPGFGFLPGKPLGWKVIIENRSTADTLIVTFKTIGLVPVYKVMNSWKVKDRVMENWEVKEGSFRGKGKNAITLEPKSKKIIYFWDQNTSKFQLSWKDKKKPFIKFKGKQSGRMYGYDTYITDVKPRQ